MVVNDFLNSAAFLNSMPDTVLFSFRVLRRSRLQTGYEYIDVMESSRTPICLFVSSSICLWSVAVHYAHDSSAWSL